MASVWILGACTYSQRAILAERSTEVGPIPRRLVLSKFLFSQCSEHCLQQVLRWDNGGPHTNITVLVGEYDTRS